MNLRYAPNDLHFKYNVWPVCARFVSFVIVCVSPVDQGVSSDGHQGAYERKAGWRCAHTHTHTHPRTLTHRLTG